MESLESRLYNLQSRFESYVEETDARIWTLESQLEISESPNLIEVLKEKIDLMDESLDDVCALSGELADKVEQLNYEVEYLSKHITDED